MQCGFGRFTDSRTRQHVRWEIYELYIYLFGYISHLVMQFTCAGNLLALREDLNERWNVSRVDSNPAITGW